MSDDGPLCHCPADEAGHTPGEGDCTVKVKRGNYAPDQHLGSTVDANGYPRPAALGARGTCPECGRPGVTVRLHRIKAGKVELGLEPALAAHQVHRRRGVACPGAGRPPAEIRFVPGRNVVEWIAVHGREGVA